MPAQNSVGIKSAQRSARAEWGEVYRARDEKLNRDVAIKILPAAFSRDTDRLRRFEQEAQAAGTLNHPNILAVYDVGTYGEAPYVVSELLAGETLRERLHGLPIPQRKAVDYAAQRRIVIGPVLGHEQQYASGPIRSIRSQHRRERLR